MRDDAAIRRLLEAAVEVDVEPADVIDDVARRGIRRRRRRRRVRVLLLTFLLALAAGIPTATSTGWFRPVVQPTVDDVPPGIEPVLTRHHYPLYGEIEGRRWRLVVSETADRDFCVEVQIHPHRGGGNGACGMAMSDGDPDIVSWSASAADFARRTGDPQWIGDVSGLTRGDVRSVIVEFRSGVRSARVETVSVSGFPQWRFFAFVYAGRDDSVEAVEAFDANGRLLRRQRWDGG